MEDMFGAGSVPVAVVAKVYGKDASMATDKELSSYILKAVTEGYSYFNLKARLEIPCSKDIYYELYRRFFWLLSNTRN